MQNAKNAKNKFDKFKVFYVKNKNFKFFQFFSPDRVQTYSLEFTRNLRDKILVWIH